MTTTDGHPDPIRVERERCLQLFLEHLDCVYGSVLHNPTVADSARSTLEAIESGAPYDEKLELVESNDDRAPMILQPIRVTPRTGSPAGKTARTEDILTAMADAVSPLPPKPAPAIAPRCSFCEAPVLPREDGHGYRCECESGQFWTNGAYDSLVRARLAEQQEGGE